MECCIPVAARGGTSIGSGAPPQTRKNNRAPLEPLAPSIFRRKKKEKEEEEEREGEEGEISPSFNHSWIRHWQQLTVASSLLNPEPEKIR